MYYIKEIYFTIQGEGAYSGRSIVLCRFSGCNLWSGLEKDRKKAKCNFCDTDFVGTNGINGGEFLNEKDLGKKNQIIVVTHSPQVAATGENHYLITKTIKDGENITECIKLSENQRLEEIARMLSGNKITNEARAAASKLLFN